jgi:hypothetical protein
MSLLSEHDLALSKVGLIALIDEATGFQQQRERHALMAYAARVGVSVEAVQALIDRALEIANHAAAAEGRET